MYLKCISVVLPVPAALQRCHSVMIYRSSNLFLNFLTILTDAIIMSVPCRYNHCTIIV